MKIRLFAVIVAVCLSFATLSACDIGFKNKDYSGKITDESYFTFTLDSTKEAYIVSVAEDTELPAELNLPTWYQGKPVATVGNFSNSATIEKVSIPTSYKLILASAFSNCTLLSKVTGMANVEKIGNNAFEGCAKLRDFEFGDGLKTIGKFAFAGTNIYTINFTFVETIDANAFYNCTALKTVNIPASTTKIDADAFAGCNVEFSVAEGNANYTAVNGKLISK